jgi:hypothetical protein
LCAEGYGGASDWNVIFSVRVQNAGDIEHQARSQLYRYVVTRSYWKDNVRQNGTELLQCSFSRAKEALMAVAEDAKVAEPWKARFTLVYEFDESEN